MDTAYGILVIILSITLAIFLILAIAVAIQVLKLMSTLKEIARKAEIVVDNAEAVSGAIKKVSGPVSLIHFIKSVMDSAAEHKQKKRGDKSYE